MTTMKKLVFISHMKTERELAMAFKKLVQKAFLGMIDVFVSSDPDSLSMGKKWLQEITDALKRCDVEVVFASPASTPRPWINFEAGAGWIRDIPVIPICHSGVTPETCYPILNNLQGGTATSETEMKQVFHLLAKTLECDKPDIDFSEFIATVKAFENDSQAIVEIERQALTSQTSGLRDYEIATLVACGNEARNPDDSLQVQSIRDRMESAGFAPIATTLGLVGLERYGFVATFNGNDGNYEYAACRVQPDGWSYLQENADRIELKVPPRPPKPGEIPF